MAVNREKIVAGAQKFVQRGQLDKAIKEYQRVLEEDPKDVRTLLKIGDLYSKKGERENATQTYLKVAEFYSDQGFFLKAVAVYKQILKVDPGLVQVNVKLADLYNQLGLASDALAQYQSVALHFEKAGDIPKTIGILRKMIELEPNNVGSRIKLAEVYAKQAMTSDATGELGKAAALLKQNGRLDDYARVSERILHLQPDDATLSLELAEFYLERNDVKRALAKLQVCFKANPRDVRTLEMLAQSFTALGQTHKTISVYRELAKIYEASGDDQKRRHYLRKILELAPDDEEAKEVDLRAPNAPAPTPRSPETGEVVPARPLPAQKPSEALQKLLTETDVYMKYGLRDKALEHLKKIFAIAPDNLDAHAKVRDIYLKSGEIDGAKRTLLTMGKIGIAQDQTERARGWLQEALALDAGFAEAKALIATLPDDMTEEIEEVIEDADEVEVASPDGLELEVEVEHEEEPEPAAQPTADEHEASPEDEGMELDMDSPSDDAGIALEEDEPLPTPPAIDTGHELELEPPDDELSPPEEHELAPPAVEHDLALEPARDLSLPEEHTPPPTDLAEFDHGPVHFDEEDTLPVSSKAAASAPAPLEEEEDQGAGSDELDEGEFFEQQGLTDEAIEAYRNALKIYPRSKHAKARLAALTGEAAGAEPEQPKAEPAKAIAPKAEPKAEPVKAEPVKVEPAKVEPAKPAAAESAPAAHPAPQIMADEKTPIGKPSPKVAIAPAAAARPVAAARTADAGKAAGVTKQLISDDALGGDDFDLASELADDFTDAQEVAAKAEQQDDLQFSAEEIFSEFKKGVAATVSDKDFATHYDLGIAYKEMGLMEDAVREFEVSARAPEKQVDALTMVGICRMGGGDAKAAIAAFKRAANSDHITPKQALAVKYELAAAMDLNGDADAAQALFAKVAESDPTFRDAKSRAGGAKSDPTPDDDSPASEGKKDKISYV